MTQIIKGISPLSTGKDPNDARDDSQYRQRLMQEYAASALEQQPHHYPLIWLRDIKPRIDTPSLIRGVIKPDSMIVTYGESNSGKTFHVLDRDLCLAMGRAWYGMETEGGFVLYIAAEGAHSVENRVAAYRDDLLDDQSSVPFAILPQPVDLLKPEADAATIVDFIKRLEDERGVRCIKVTADTLARVIAGGNENSPEDMGALISNADHIRHEIGCAFEFVHHSGKDTARGARGHSSLRAATDTEIEVVNNHGLHIAKVTKQRDLPIGDEFAFSLRVVNLGNDLHGHPVTTCIPEWELEHQTGKKNKLHLTGPETKVLTIIREKLTESREYPPASVNDIKSNRIKPGQYACPLDAIRKRIKERGGLSQVDTVDAQIKANQRAFQGLESKGFIQIFEGWVWLVDNVDMGGHA